MKRKKLVDLDLKAIVETELENRILRRTLFSMQAL